VFKERLMNSHGLLCVNKATNFFTQFMTPFSLNGFALKLSVHVLYQLSTLTEVCSKWILVSWKVLWIDVKAQSTIVRLRLYRPKPSTMLYIFQVTACPRGVQTNLLHEGWESMSSTVVSHWVAPSFMENPLKLCHECPDTRYNNVQQQRHQQLSLSSDYHECTEWFLMCVFTFY
jgi:hypothetical protein